MEKINLSQLLEWQNELAQKALLLQSISDYKTAVDIRTDINDEDYFTLSVQYGDSYTSDCKKWEASQARYAEDKTLHANEADYIALRQFFDDEIAAANKRAQSIVARVAALFNTKA